MPDTLSLSTGVSLGLLAGIVSGVCYLVANGLTWSSCRVQRRGLPAAAEDPCRRCGGDPLGGDLPCICYKPSRVKFRNGAWFLRQVQRTLSLMPWSFSTDKLEQIDEEREGGDASAGSEPGLGGVREFLEALSARLAGGPLDQTPVHQLYSHPAYLPTRERSTLDPSTARSGVASGASGAHAQLKRLVARVIEEAASLPALARYAAEPSTPIENSTYEDLLATAILNRVIERYQAESGSGGRSSGIHSASASPTPSERSSPRSPHTHLLRDVHRDETPPLRDDEEEIEWQENEIIEETIELPKRIPFPEFGGDIVHTSENDDHDFDEVSGSDLQASDGTWEENWLFQKKKIKTIQSVPVPMLVPNSNTEYRVLIGDKDVDDTSDLSDNTSDAEGETEFKSDIKRVLDSKHVIGGKPVIDDFLDIQPDSLTNLDEIDDTETGIRINQKLENNSIPVLGNNNEIEIENDKIDINNDPTNGVSDGTVLTVEIDSGPLLKPEFVVTEIHRAASYNKITDGLPESLNEIEHNDLQFDAKQSKDTISSNNGHEEEMGYEEAVDVPVQRYADSLRRKYYGTEDQKSNVIEDHDDKNADSDLIPGSIADRERKKWLNYVDMPNNPYSPEAIQKRLSAKSASSIFDTLSSSKNSLSDVNNTCTVVHSTTEKQSDDEKYLKREKNPDRKNDSTLNNIHTDNESVNSARTNSPSPRILKDILAEEVPQYKRYGRDYYIREAKKSSGGRKKSYSDTSSMSSLNKSASLDNFDNDFTSPVSASSSLSDLEAASLHHNIVRAVLSPRNASPNFAINPIYENTDKTHNESSPSDNPNSCPNTNHVRQKTFKRGDGHVENEDIVRLKIPNRPEIVEESFETYSTVRRSNTLRSEDFYVRPKRRTDLNYNFGGSLRLNKNINDNLCYVQFQGLLIKQFNSIATNQQFAVFSKNNPVHESITTTCHLNNKKNEVSVEYDDDATEQTLFSAKAVYIADDTDQRFEEILQSVKSDSRQINHDCDKIIDETELLKSPTNQSVAESFISSSSLEDSVKIYNVQTGEIVSCKPSDSLSEDRCDMKYDCNDNVDDVDNTLDKAFEKKTEEKNLRECNGANGNQVGVSVKKKMSIDELDLPKVKDLARIFVTSMEPEEQQDTIQVPTRRRKGSQDNILNGDVAKSDKTNKQAYMHSLTARSISKEFRDELRLSMATPLKVPGGSNELPEGIEDVIKESSRPGSPLPEPGTLKTKLAFFESLKSKFNSKS